MTGLREAAQAAHDFMQELGTDLYASGGMQQVDKLNALLIELRAALAAVPAPAAAQQPIHITVLVDWLSARYRAAGGKHGITDLSAWAEEVMRWTEQHHGIGGDSNGQG